MYEPQWKRIEVVDTHCWRQDEPCTVIDYVTTSIIMVGSVNTEAVDMSSRYIYIKGLHVIV